MDEPTAILVYGTLKRGEVREKCWARKPVAVEEARVRGALFDLGPYPGLVEGEDVVAGELWRFNAEDMPGTLAALDEVEGFYGRGDDEYRRVVIECKTATGIAEAWAYMYARVTRLRADQRVMPNELGICQWSRRTPDERVTY